MKVITKRKDLSLRRRRQQRIRSKISGTPERPRLNIFCSLKYVYAQLIDDVSAKVIVAANSSGKDCGIEGSRANVNAAAEIGKKIAEAALAANITNVVLDRAGYKYHGKIKALADAKKYCSKSKDPKLCISKLDLKINKLQQKLQQQKEKFSVKHSGKSQGQLVKR